MQTTLCFDFGNTRLKCAVFKDRDFFVEKVLEQADMASVKALLDEFVPNKSILSSVINHSPYRNQRGEAVVDTYPDYAAPFYPQWWRWKRIR